MKITILEPLGISDAKAAQYKEALEAGGHTVTWYPDRSSDPAVLSERTGDSDIVVIANTPYPASVIRAAGRLKLIAVAFTGIDHIALDACRERGITVCNAAGYSTPAVAELAVGLAISCLRKMSSGEDAVRNGGNSRGLTGREIAGKTVGIVGTGTIGQYAARLFSAFGAKVLLSSRTKRTELERDGVRYVSMEELFSDADIISVHVASNAETRRLVSRELIGRMKSTAILINTARGAVVDNEALAEALKAGWIGGAGIDVFDTEPPLSKEYCLLNCPNLVPLPHVGFLTEESMERRAEIVFETVEAFLNGSPINVCC